MSNLAVPALEGVALSFQQNRIWRLQQETHRNLRTRFAIIMRGPLDRACLEAAWHQVEERHQILRTSFEYLPGIKDPLQVVQPHGTNLHFADTKLNGDGPFTPELFLEMESRKSSADGNQVFATLYEVNKKRHILAFSLPVLLADGETARIIFQELCRFYQSSGARQDETIQYAQFSEWYSELLAGDDIAESRSWWQQRGELSATDFPLKRKRDSAFNPASTVAIPLSRELRGLLDQAAQLLESTIPDFLFAAWQVLLYRFTGQSPVVLGCLVDGRKYEELDGMPGLTARYLPMVCPMTGNLSFRNVLNQSTIQRKDVYQYQEGFPDGSSERLPVVFESYTLPPAQTIGKLTFRLAGVISEVDLPDLVLSCTQDDKSLAVVIRFDPDVYDSSYVERLGESYRILIEVASQLPDVAVAEIPLLNEPKFMRWLEQINSPQKSLTDITFVHDVIVQVAQNQPHEIAIEGESVAVTYIKMLTEADGLAHQLRDLGIGTESIVAILMEHSPELIVAILGVLRSGAAYLPMDPTLPQERMAYMLEDSHARLLLTKESLVPSLPVRRPELLLVKPDWQAPAAKDHVSGEDRPNLVPENLAYLIYTSGSTGAPKASMITHRGLSNYIQWAIKAYSVEQGTGAPLHSSIGFDLTVTSVFGPLMAGKKIVLTSMEGLSNCLRTHDFSLLKVTPAHAHILGTQLSPAEAAGRARHLILGGEALRPGDIAFWQQHAPQTVLINEYGPTETVVGCCVYQITGALPENDAVPIGKPIANTQMYVLDRDLHPVPIGVTGEIYIAGEGLARGYLNRPELTAERFLPHFCSSVPGARIYRTGDLGRYLPDGNIDCLGRIDHQVKIRGYRVELGEVESELGKIPGVGQACVIARNTNRGAQLIAYLVAAVGDEQKTILVSELREHLSRYLPEYMVPAVYVWLKELPLTANGKVDRKALPSSDEAAAAGKYTEPRTLEEQILCGIWSQVLSLERVGIDDNYFTLGGDSIRSLQIITRAAERGMKFTVGDLFRHQTVRALAQNLENLKLAPEVKAGVFSLITPEDQRLLPEDAEAAYPLTRLQAGMVFHRELHPESAVYHDIGTFHLRIPLREELLRESIGRVFASHPALRTSFDLVRYSQPLQIVHREVPAPLTVSDLTHLDDAAQKAALAEWIEGDKRRPFDVTRYPLVRFHVHKRSAETFQFSLSFHHAVLDGWSDASMLTEIANHYLYALRGETFEQPPLQTQFRDFVLLEQQAIASQEHRRFWQERLEGSEFIRVPRWQPTPIEQKRGIGFYEVEISDELSNALKSLALSAAVPIKNVLLAAHMRALAMLSGNADVTTLLTSVGRPETRDGDRVFGLFLNSTPFRMKLSGGKWRELVDEAFALETAAVPFRRFPMVEIQKLLGRDQLSETGFYFTHYHIYHHLEKFEQFQLLEDYYYEETNITLLANFAVASFTDKVRFYLTCDQTEIGPEQLAVIAGYYHRILIEMAMNPNAHYDALSFLSTQEYESAMAAAGHCEAQPLSEPWVHEQFSRQAVLTPDAVAVSDDTGHLTYKQLDQQSNQLAHYLRSQGVQSEVVVGLFLERSLDLAVSVLAVLKAGGIYLPLDPGYPRERLDFILHDARVQTLITQQNFNQRFAGLLSTVSILYIDVERNSLPNPTQEPPRSAIFAETLAYVIYTSGSTGRPKGVMISHGNLANYISWCKANYLPPQGKGSLVHSSISFDLTVTSLLAPLVIGQTSAMVADAAGIESLGNALRHNRDLSFVKLTPSHLRLLREQLPEDHLAGHTNSLIIGGEALHWEDIQHWHNAAPECRMINEYGPTEATVGCSVFSVEGATAAHAGAVPIGRPITNATLYVLDEFLQPVPLMTPGELFIGGLCVARGYLNRPDLTAEKFIPDPFSSIAGLRLYRTGDLAKLLPDGNLEFLGRRDSQLKIRGFRIELGEIQSVLNGHESVARAVVLARSFQNSDRQLVAYVVPARSTMNTDELRSWLQGKLPDYMVPAVIVPLEKLPLTRNGKVDHAALPDPEVSRAAGLPEFVAPRTPEEQILAGVWAKVLKAERVGIDDDYFALGGDSIRSIQTVALSRERGVQFTLHQLFQNPTVRRLAESLREQQLGSAESPATTPFSLISDSDRALLPADVEDAYPLSRMQTGMLYHRELHPDAAIYHDVMSFHVKAPFRQDLLEHAIGRLCSRHPALRTSFDLSHYSIPLQLVHTSVRVPLAVEDLRRLSRDAQETAINEWVEKDKARGFDISKAPLLRFQIHRRSDQTLQFTLCFHHAILDGWSDATLQTELAQSYMFLLYGEEPPFTPPQTRYREFIALEREVLRSPEARDFWLKKLEGAEPILLPRPHHPVSGPVDKRGVFRVDVPIPPALSEQLQKFALSAAVPVKTVLLAAHLAVMQWISGNSDVLTSVIANGRLETSDGDRVLGLFLNSSPFRITVGAACWTDLVKDTFAGEREILPFRRYPLSELQKLLKRQRLSEVVFYFTHYHIYNQLQRFAELEVLEDKPYEESSFTLVSMFSVNPFTNRVAAQLCCDRTQVSQPFAEFMAAWYAQALTSLTADPESCVASSPALSPEQRHTVLSVWNNNRREYAHNATIARIFEEQVRANPFATALVSDEQTLSYDELNRRANQVARWLARQGAAPETLVGLYMECSLETYVAMLGIVKAGAAYVPLDPADPAPPLEFFVKDSGNTFVLTTEKLQARLPASVTRVIPLDRFWKDISAEKDLNPEVNASAENLAYLMYTSGTTGRRKPVAVPHHGVVRLVENNWPADLSGVQTFLQNTALSFHVSAWEIWGALLNGARLVISRSSAASLEHLEKVIRRHRVSVLWLTAPLFHQVVDDAPHILKLVKTLFVGGNVLSPARVIKALSHQEGGALINGYVITENTTFASCHRIYRADQIATPIPIGRPLANTRMYVLSENLEPLPPGITGELFIGGDGLARGYFNRPDWTAEKFIPDPFSAQPGERLFRTGDLVRFAMDGELEFVGRIDTHIVEVRGFRVKLGEIESILHEHPDVHEAVVAVRGSGSAQRIVAYVAAPQGRDLPADDFMRFLQRRLPEFMVPSAVIVMDRIPLKTSGKIDDEALLALEEHHDARPWLPSQTALESELAAMWQKILAVPRVGREDNFFELDGNLLLANQLVSSITEHYQIPLTLRELMQAPTLAGLAEVVEIAIWASHAQQSADQDVSKEELIV